MTKTPFVLLGDAPGQPTGLSRILTDLATHLTRRDDLNLDIRTVGWAPWESPKAGHPTQYTPGAPQAASPAIPGWVFSNFSTYGQPALERAWREWFGNRPGIVLAIWDASRLEGLAKTNLPVQKWAYVPVDGHPVGKRLFGPAAAWLQSMSRVLAYTRFGADLLETALPARPEAIPHGLSPQWYQPTYATQDLPYQQGPILGCVATNQRRKDLGLFFETLSLLEGWSGWLHTNELVSDAWSVPQLAAEFRVEGKLRVSLHLDDATLQHYYTACTATLAPGRGEGFGYPIAESLACGVPALHMAYGGGAEVAYPEDLLLPEVPAPFEGIYNITRPRLSADLVARCALESAALTQPLGADLRRRWAEQFSWETIWPQFHRWIAAGL